MATTMLCGPRRVVAYMPNLRTMVKHFRTFSSYDEKRHDDVFTVYEASVSETNSSWPDDRFGPLAVQDKRFPLPGKVGVTPATTTAAAVPSIEATPEPDVLTELLPQERQISILQQYLTIPREVSGETSEEAVYGDQIVSTDDLLECQALECPVLLRRDFQDLFPQRDFRESQLTVLTIGQRTTNDMSGWSPDVEEERECLMEQFVSSALEMCNSLHRAGYWADFIDPSSGKPYLGDHTNSTMFETDERYKHFGFDVEDLGCCKVIRHHVWGTHSYVGCMFTNAPVDHPILVEMTKKTEWDDC